MKLHSKKTAALVALAGMLAAIGIGCTPQINEPVGSNAASGGSTASTTDGSTITDYSDLVSGNSSASTADGSATTGSQGQQQTPGGSTSAGNPSGNTSSFKEPVYDLGGRVIVIGTEAPPDRNKDSILTESLTLTEKKYNCKFQYVQKEYVALYQDLINGHAAGKSNYDVVVLRGYEVFPNAANSGAVLDVSKYYDFANDPTWQAGEVKDLGVFKGGRYGIPFSPNEVGNGIWYNRALLRRFNVPDLWTYVENDTWNWNTFRAVCKKLTQDTNGDGKPDYWAFTSSDPWLDFIYSNNGSLISSGVSGTPKISLDSKNALDAIQFVADLHMIDNTIPDGKELGEITDKPFNAMFTGKVAMCAYHARYGAVMESMGIPSNDIGWVYFPKGPAASEYVTASGTMPDMFVVPRDISEPEKVVAAIQDVAAYWDESREVRLNISDKTEELYEALKSSLDSNAKKVLEYQAQHPVYTLANNYNLSQVLQNELWPSVLKGTSVKSAVDSVKSKLQSELTTKYSGSIVS